MKNVGFVLTALGFCFSHICYGQSLHTYTRYGASTAYSDNVSTNRYFCPPSAPSEVKPLGAPVPNVPMATPGFGLGGNMVNPVGDTVCIDMTKEPGAVALFMQRDKHHAEVVSVMERQTAATEKLALQMEAWMKKAETDLRSAIDAKFKALPSELVASQPHVESLDALRERIIKEVECRRDPINGCG